MPYIDDVAQQQLHTDEQLVGLFNVGIIGKLLDIDDVAIGYHTVVKTVQTPGRAKRGIEDKREGSIVAVVHALVEAPRAPLGIGTDGELQIVGKDRTVGIAHVVAVAIAMVVIVLDGIAARLQGAASAFKKILCEENGFQYIGMFHKAVRFLIAFILYTVDSDFAGNNAKLQHTALVLTYFIMFLQ